MAAAGDRGGRATQTGVAHARVWTPSWRRVAAVRLLALMVHAGWRL
jgi:hypothetical protein